MKQQPINILYLSYDGMTDPLGQSQVLPYIIGLTKKGYNFTLISCEKKERFHRNKTIIEDICSEHNIDWQPIMYTKSPPVLSTLWDILQINKKAKELHKVKHFSLFHCRSYITSIVGLGFKQKHQVKFLFDMRGFWADERVDGGLWDKIKIPYKQIYNYFKKKERLFLSESDAVVSLTHEGKKEILSRLYPSCSPEKVKVIPTCVDLKLFNYKRIEKSNTERVKFELDISHSDYILTYLGSLGTWYLVDEMLDFFVALKKIKNNSKFVFFTADNPHIILDKIVDKQINIEDIRIKKLERKEVPVYLSISDLSISFIKPLYSKKASSPTKMGEILAMGIPMVCNSNVGDVEQIIEENNCGIIVHELNNTAYLEAISKISSLSNFPKKHYYDIANKVFSLEQGVSDFDVMYKQILSE